MAAFYDIWSFPLELVEEARAYWIFRKVSKSPEYTERLAKHVPELRIDDLGPTCHMNYFALDRDPDILAGAIFRVPVLKVVWIATLTLCKLQTKFNSSRSAAAFSWLEAPSVVSPIMCCV